MRWGQEGALSGAGRISSLRRSAVARAIFAPSTSPALLLCELTSGSLTSSMSAWSLCFCSVLIAAKSEEDQRSREEQGGRGRGARILAEKEGPTDRVSTVREQR